MQNWRAIRETATKILLLDARRNPGDMQRNRITGSTYLLGKDSLDEQIDSAVTRLTAMARFGRNGPGGRRLPLNFEEREALKDTGDPDCVLLALFSRSLEQKGYDLDRHPTFDGYAAGFLYLCTPYRDLFRGNDPSVFKRYPPHPLPGLSADSYWM